MKLLEIEDVEGVRCADGVWMPAIQLERHHACGVLRGYRWNAYRVTNGVEHRRAFRIGCTVHLMPWSFDAVGAAAAELSAKHYVSWLWILQTLMHLAHESVDLDG